MWVLAGGAALATGVIHGCYDTKKEAAIQGSQTGPQGLQGDPCSSGLATTQIREATITVNAADDARAVEAYWQSGEILTGGEFDVPSDNQLVHITASKPAPDNEWKVFVANADPFSTRQVTAYAVCAGS